MVHMTNKEQTHDLLSLRNTVWVFLAFAAAYFLSALLRAITATLSPTLSMEFGLQARDLGLLAGGYFLGFSMTQLPLGHWLDKHGPKKVVLRFLAVAVVGCIGVCLGDKFCWIVAFAHVDRCWRQRMFDGAFDRLPPLAHTRDSAACEFVDVDDRFIRHACLHFAGAMAITNHRLALDVWHSGIPIALSDGPDGDQST
jgi:hypothetical protein